MRYWKRGAALVLLAGLLLVATAQGLCPRAVCVCVCEAPSAGLVQSVDERMLKPARDWQAAERAGLSRARPRVVMARHRFEHVQLSPFRILSSPCWALCSGIQWCECHEFPNSAPHAAAPHLTACFRPSIHESGPMPSLHPPCLHARLR